MASVLDPHGQADLHPILREAFVMCAWQVLREASDGAEQMACDLLPAVYHCQTVGHCWDKIGVMLDRVCRA